MNLCVYREYEGPRIRIIHVTKIYKMLKVSFELVTECLLAIIRLHMISKYICTLFWQTDRHRFVTVKQHSRV